jgi:putative transposase
MRFAFSETQARINYMLRTERMQWSEPKDVWRHIGSLAASIEPHECSNYFANAGYASVKM